MNRKIFLLLIFISSLSFANENYDTNKLFRQKNASTEIQEELSKDSVLSIDKKNTEEVADNTKHFNQLIHLLSICLVGILSLLSLALFRNYSIQRKANKLLQEKNKELELEKEKSEQAIKAKFDFLATISHELRTPLNAINIISDILMEEDPKKSQLENLVSLKISANYLLNLINDVLQINKIESPSFKIEEREFKIISKIENIKNTLNEIAKSNNVKCQYNIDSRIPNSLVGDDSKLHQVLMNLVANAIKFSKNGNVITNLKLIEKTSDIVSIKFEVIDDGIGVPLDKQKVIFEEFTQASPEINHKFGGTGLGLTIVKKLLNHLESEIHLESEENKGSHFSFIINFKKNKNEELNDDLDYTLFKNQEILIVEDNIITQAITQKLILKNGARCTIAENGTEALDLILTKKIPYDLILMDINLPDLNGDLVALEIRKANIQTPIIAFTAIHDENIRKEIAAKGVNDFISKPVNTRSFYEKIINLLKEKEHELLSL